MSRRFSILILFGGLTIALVMLFMQTSITPIARAVSTTSDCFALSNEAPGDLISKLDVAGWGNFNLYQALLQMQGGTNPSVAGIITPAFLNALAACPGSSAIFTTH